VSDRRFTVEEANQALQRIRESRQVVLDGARRIRGLAARDGGGSDSGPYLEALRTLRREMQGLAEDDIILRDADRGLVDFPAERDGREVFLCWRLGEERVGFWHDPDTGFAGRRPL
jgi:hypothetical protein